MYYRIFFILFDIQKTITFYNYRIKKQLPDFSYIFVRTILIIS